jgi:nitrogen fixation NifU-like protein
MAEDQLELFRDIIIEHSQFPRNHGKLDAPTHEGTAENPLCGDRIRLQLVVNADQVIEDIAFEATGCAMSLASASLLVSHLKGKNIAAASELFEGVHSLFSDDPAGVDEDKLGELTALGVARRFPARVKCVTMPWHHLNSLLNSETGSVDSVY